MSEVEKVKKVIHKLQHFVKCLDSLQKLCVHRNINQTYYMQKVAELEILHEQMTDLLEKEKAIRKLASILCPEIIARWKEDARWLHQYSIRHSIECPNHQDLSM